MEKTGDSVDGLVEIDGCRLIDELPGAYYFAVPGAGNRWIRKSETMKGSASKIGDTGKLVVTAQTAKKHGIK